MGGFRIEKRDKEYVESHYSNALPLWKFILFCTISFGLYEIFWCYRNWNHIKQKYELKILPLARSIFSQFFIYFLFKRILNMAKEKGYKKNYMPSVLALIYIVQFLITSLANTGKGILPYELWLLSIVSFIPFIPAVNAMNYYWQQEQPKKAVRNVFTNGELIFTAIFGILFLLNVKAFFFK